MGHLRDIRDMLSLRGLCAGGAYTCYKCLTPAYKPCNIRHPQNRINHHNCHKGTGLTKPPNSPMTEILMPSDDEDIERALLSSSHSPHSNSKPSVQHPLISDVVHDRNVNTVSQANETRRIGLEERKSITYWQGIALIIGRQIGGGIFSIPALVNGNTGSVGLSLTVWIICGFVAYMGACSSQGIPV